MTAPSEDIPVTATATVEDIPVTKLPADPGTPRLAVEDLRIVMPASRRRPETDVVDNVSFTVQPGHVLGLVGESGSGKTTVALALLGLVKRGLEIGGGKVLIDGRDILALSEHELQKMRGRTVAYVPQDPGSALNPVLKVGTQLREVFAIHGGDAGRLTQVMAEADLEDQKGSGPILGSYPHQLSGGQQQRVALAMAFACRPRLIVLDEPTTGLDVTTQRRVLDTVRGLCHTYQVAAVYISHDLAVVAEIADHVAVLYSGRLIEVGAAGELFARPAHPYTRGLMRAVPSMGSSHELHGMAGSPPRPGNRPAGCSFRPRCEFAVAECELREPAAVVVSDTGHAARCVRAAEVTALSGTALRARERTVARYPDELSGGERQRVALARALVVDPELLVCDEITSALDVSVQAAIVELLLRLQAERGLSLMFITHNLPLVRSIADDVTVISAGQVCERGPVTQVLTAPTEAYTRQLIADVPGFEHAG
jgi:oligopeptide/dipeptide ABC transporter ATP-binding protein